MPGACGSFHRTPPIAPALASLQYCCPKHTLNAEQASGGTGLCGRIGNTTNVLKLAVGAYWKNTNFGCPVLSLGIVRWRTYVYRGTPLFSPITKRSGVQHEDVQSSQCLDLVACNHPQQGIQGNPQNRKAMLLLRVDAAGAHDRARLQRVRSCRHYGHCNTWV